MEDKSRKGERKTGRVRFSIAHLSRFSRPATIYARKQQAKVVAALARSKQEADHAKAALATTYNERGDALVAAGDLSHAALWYTRALESEPQGSSARLLLDRVRIGSTLRFGPRLLDVEPSEKETGLKGLREDSKGRHL